jgi:hypothetical protein
VLGDPFFTGCDDFLGAIRDLKHHMDHRGLLALTDLLVLLMLIVHLLLEVQLEAKGFLNPSGELGKPNLSLGEG